MTTSIDNNNVIILNQISAAGISASEPRVKIFESGAQLAEIPMYVRTPGKDSLFTVKAWGKLAEVAANYIKKGSRFTVHGSFEGVNSWESDEYGATVTRYKSIIKADRIVLQDSKPTAA